VYPFLGGDAIEKAAQGLFLYEEKNYNASFLLQLQKEKCHPRYHSMKISKKDRRKLEPGKWLNDVIIDFWMQWITRMESQSDSSIYVFTSFFYTKLSTEGVETVINWLTNKEIDIFSKKMALIPIHQDHHWSLAVVINAGLVDFCNEDDEPSEIPCILHMDGLSLHDRRGIAANIRIWLNAEWNKKKSVNVNMFTVLTMDSFSVLGKPTFCSTHVNYNLVTSLSNNNLFFFQYLSS